VSNNTAAPRTVEVQMARHITERRHSTFTAQVPVEMLTDPRYFDQTHEAATGAFDQWMCDNGTESDVEYGEDGRGDDLYFEVDGIAGGNPDAWFDARAVEQIADELREAVNA
jgi:hypothetical protein